MGKLTTPDPRNLLPSRADPEHRGRRKELEKKHGYGYTEPLVLAMIGIGLVWNIENQVSKREARKDEEEKKVNRRRKESQSQRRSGSMCGTSRERESWDRRGETSESRYVGRDDERSSSRRHRDVERNSSVYKDEYRDDPPRLDYRAKEYRGFRDQYRDYRNDSRCEDRRDGSVQRSSRRDSS